MNNTVSRGSKMTREAPRRLERAGASLHMDQAMRLGAQLYRMGASYQAPVVDFGGGGGNGRNRQKSGEGQLHDSGFQHLDLLG